MLIEFNLLEKVMRITCHILQNNFFYDEGSLARFLNNYHERVETAYKELEDNADKYFRNQMNCDKNARKSFTAYFASSHLHDTLVQDCHFSDDELYHFDNILPKYTGVTKDGIKPSEQRTNYRELFKGL